MLNILQELEDLKCDIAKAACNEPYMQEEYPLPWLKFHRAVLQKAEKGTHYLRLSEVFFFLFVLSEHNGEQFKGSQLDAFCP